MIEIKNLSCTYSKKNEDVIKDISMNFEEENINIILGKNGAGKSTIIKCLTSLLNYSQGEIYIDSKNLKEMKLKDKAKLIGYVPQDNESSYLSVFETVLLGRIPYLSYRYAPSDYQKVEQVLFELGIEHLSSKKVCELSGGEKQKVAIGRTLVQGSKYIIFDEPTSSLDISSQINIFKLIKRLVKEKGITPIISMHDLNLSIEYGDRFFFLKERELVKSGSKEIITSKLLNDVFDVDIEIKNIEDKQFIVHK